MATTMTATQTERKTMYQQMDDIFDAITWGDLARTYFDKNAGCFLARHGKEHDKWTNSKTGKSERVSRHAGEVPTGMALKILKKLVGE